MKTINVVAAIIKHGNQILATQRGDGDYKGKWEFPGGKIEEGESPEQALIREIKEELDVEIRVNELVDIVEHDYPTFRLKMSCFYCEIISGDLVLNEHLDAKWLRSNELDTIDWLPSDLGLIEDLIGKF